MSSDKQSLYIAILAIVLAVAAIGLSFTGPAEGPRGPAGADGGEGVIGSAGPSGPAGPAGAAGIVDVSLLAPGPGINLEVTDVVIGSDRVPKVYMTVTDAAGKPMTEDDFSIRWMLASIEEYDDGRTWYKNYYTKDVEGSEYTFNGVTMQPALTGEVQPDRDSGEGTWTELSPGELVYTFADPVPADYDASSTHLLAGYGYQPSRDEIVNVVWMFVPNGGTLDGSRLISETESCNQCHDPLAVHGGTRQEVTLCLTCHTPDAVDPESGNTVDMKVMIHKIHMGENLPSVEEGEPYYIVGYRNTVHDYSDVVFPMDVRNCETCHTGPEGDSWKTQPSRDACGSCHDDIVWETGEGHSSAELVQTSDASCSNCHSSEMGSEFDRSIPGAHVIPDFSSQLPGTNIDIIGVEDTGPGENPTITFTVKNDAGEQIQLADIDRVYFVVAGPNTDYAISWRENALADTVDNGDGTYSYTTKDAIPADATGSWSIGVEGRTVIVIDDGTAEGAEIRDLSMNEVYAISVTDAVAVPRRTIVSQENCESCHENLYLHGGNRRSVEYCSTCHIPGETDEEVRPTEAMPPTTIDFKVMIHRIHYGEEGGEPYEIYGYRGSLHDFGELRYPGDLANCDTCHVDDSYQLPISSGVLGTTVEEDGALVSYTPPIQSACLACHTTDAPKAHTETMTSSGAEACAVCHAPGKDFEVLARTGTVAEIQFHGID